MPTDNTDEKQSDNDPALCELRRWAREQLARARESFALTPNANVEKIRPNIDACIEKLEEAKC